MDTEEKSEYIELVRIGDPIQADLLAAFLEDGDVEFQVLNRSGAGMMSQLIPRASNPVVFRVLAEDEERAQLLLDEYHKLQSAEIVDGDVPDEFQDIPDESTPIQDFEDEDAQQ